MIQLEEMQNIHSASAHDYPALITEVKLFDFLKLRHLAVFNSLLISKARLILTIAICV